MSYPDIYEVGYNYTGFQQAQGDNSFPGTQLDADLAGLQDSIENVAAFLEGFTRSDGALKNGVVTYDSLSPGLQINGLAPAVAWAAATSFKQGVAVVENSNLYRSTKAHTSSNSFAADLAAGFWTFVTAVQPGPEGPQGDPGPQGVPVRRGRATLALRRRHSQSALV